MAPCLHVLLITSCASGVFGAFLLPEPLSSPGWWAFPSHPGSPESQAPPPLEEGGGGATRAVQMQLLFCVLRFVGSATADEGRGSEGQGRGHLSDWWDGVPSPTATAAQLVLAMGTPAIRRLESRAPTLLLPLGSLKLQAQLHVSEGDRKSVV